MDNPNDTTTKRCTDCGEIKPLDAFAKNRTRRDGHTSQCKACRKLYRERTVEARREYQKKYYEEHAEFLREKSRKYHAEHRDQIVAKFRISYREKIEYHKAYHLRHYAANRETILERDRVRRETHPERQRKYQKAYRATEHGKVKHRLSQSKRRGAKSDSVPLNASEIEAIRTAQTDKRGRLICWRCGKPIIGETHLDHWIPLAKGGTNDAGNLHYMHPKCNVSKGAKHPTEIGRLL